MNCPAKLFLFRHHYFIRIRLQQQAKSLLSSSLSLLYLFFSNNAAHTINIPIPYLGLSPRISSSRLVLRYIQQKRRETRWREETSQSHQRRTKSPLFSDSAIFRERRLRSARPFARFCTPGRPGKHVNRCRE